MMLAAELALAGTDVAIVERRASPELAGSRAGGLHSRTIEVLDQRGIADRFLAAGRVAQVAGFSAIPLDISDFPTRHPYGLALWQDHIERILAGWVGELKVPVYRGREVTGFAQDDAGVDVELACGASLRGEYLVGAGPARARSAQIVPAAAQSGRFSWKIEILLDRTAPCAQMPRTSSRTVLTVTTHHLAPAGTAAPDRKSRDPKGARERGPAIAWITARSESKNPAWPVAGERSAGEGDVAGAGSPPACGAKRVPGAIPATADNSKKRSGPQKEDTPKTRTCPEGDTAR